MKKSLARSFLNSLVPINPSIVLSPSDMCTPGRFVIFLRLHGSHPIHAERDESGRDASLRMLSVQFVSPNRIELIQLIVQRVAAIFCHQDRVSVIHKRDIIERSMVGVAQDNERDVSTVCGLRRDRRGRFRPRRRALPAQGLLPGDDYLCRQ